MRLLKPMITRKMVAAVDVVVSLLPTMHFSVACVARGLTVTKPNQDANMATSADFDTLRLMEQPSKKSRKRWCEGSLVS